MKRKLIKDEMADGVYWDFTPKGLGNYYTWNKRIKQ